MCTNHFTGLLTILTNVIVDIDNRCFLLKVSTVLITILFPKVIGNIFYRYFYSYFCNDNLHSYAILVPRPFLVVSLCVKVAVNDHPWPANHALCGIASRQDAITSLAQEVRARIKTSDKVIRALAPLQHNACRGGS